MRLAPRGLLAGVLILAGIGAAASATSISTITPGTPSQVAALVTASVHIRSLTSAQEDALAAAGNQNADRYYKFPVECDTLTACNTGDLTAKVTVVVLGDSHARMWLPALATLATTDKFKIVVLGRDGCPIIAYKVFAYADCVGVMSHEIKLIDQIKPAAVVAGDRTTELPAISLATWQSAATALLEALKGSGAKVALVGDVQAFNLEPISCLAEHPTGVQNCSAANPDTAKPGHNSAEQAAATAAGVTYVNPQPWLCTATRCSPVVGSFFGYWDDTHISIQYAKYLTNVLGAALKSTLPAA